MSLIVGTILVTGIVLVAFFLGEQEKPPSNVYAEVNAALVKNHILPRYKKLAATTENLATTADMFCAGTGDVELDQVRERFHQTMDAWMGVQHIRFGPVTLLLRGSTLYFWPEGRGKIGDAVQKIINTGDTRAFENMSVRNTSAAIQGLPAVEYLLYGPSGINDDSAGDSFHCQFLMAITANVRSLSSDMLRDWQGGKMDFAQTIARAGPANRYFSTHKEATIALFRSLQGGLQLIADIKLAPIVGESSQTARPRLAESRLSGRSLRNISINLEALEALYLGEGGPGFSDLVRNHAKDTALDDLLRKAFRTTRETAQSIDQPLTKAVLDPEQRPKVEKLTLQANALSQLVKTRLADGLDLVVGFNALDGD